MPVSWSVLARRFASASESRITTREVAKSARMIAMGSAASSSPAAAGPPAIAADRNERTPAYMATAMPIHSPQYQATNATHTA
jgi:hypothetical protein